MAQVRLNYAAKSGDQFTPAILKADVLDVVSLSGKIDKWQSTLKNDGDPHLNPLPD
jgi:hypothetical protein